MGFQLLVENQPQPNHRRPVRSSQNLFNSTRDFSQLRRGMGNQVIQSLLSYGRLQPKLTIGAINDPAEREADAVAAGIMGAAPGRNSSKNSNQQGSLQANNPFFQSPSSSVPGIVEQVLHSVGHPLDSATRDFFEPRLGQNLGHIRVHSDESAADSARSIHALAYTSGRDIVFASGQYSPHTDGGKRLLAHELAHTVQQSSRASNAIHRSADLGGLNISVFHANTNVPITGAKIHIDQKNISGSKTIDLVTDSSGNAPYIQVEEGTYTITVSYQCCQQTQDVHVTGNQDQMSFFPFGRCGCGIASNDPANGGGSDPDPATDPTA